jgi:hypothetical protein
MSDRSRLRLQFEAIEDLDLAIEHLPGVLGRLLSVAPDAAAARQIGAQPSGGR